MKHFIDGQIIAFDTETTGVDIWHGDVPFAFSFANEAGETAYFEFIVDPFTRRPILNREAKQQLNQICALLEDPSILKILHNGKFDCRMMEMAYDIHICGPARQTQTQILTGELPGLNNDLVSKITPAGRIIDGALFHDTLIMSHNCNTLEPSLGLKNLGDKYCEIDKSDQQLLKKTVQRLRRYAEHKLNWNVSYDIKVQHDGTIKRKAQVAADYWIPNTLHHLHPQLVSEQEAALCGDYAKKDAIRTMMLYLLYSDLMNEYDTHEIYCLEMDLWSVLYPMETRGVRTDKQKFEAQMNESRSIMKRLMPNIEAGTWPGFRPKNPGDNRKLFFDILQVPIEKYTPGGKDGTKKLPAVDKFVIKKLLHFPVIRDLAEWQSNYVAFNSFFWKFHHLSIPDPLFPGCTAIHTDYRQVGGDQAGHRGGVATGRISSSPNLQNVMTPENTNAVHPLHVRPAFIPRPGFVWVCSDYSGMEIYMFAAISNEPTMMRAIREGRSIHEEMTDMIWGGKDNPDAIKQMVRALALDGTGMHTSDAVDALWKEWGINEDNLPSLTYADKCVFADHLLSQYNYSQVEAQRAIKRNNAKTIIKSLSFLKIYGGGARKASLLLEGSIEEAKRVLDLYDRLFPDVSAAFNKLMMEGKTYGFITSKWGRRLAIDPKWAYRATNYMVQGSSADCMKRAMVRINEFITTNEIDAHILMTIHDEIIVEVRTELLTQGLVKAISDIMCDTEGHLPIQMAVEAKLVTKNWSIKEKVNLDKLPK